ncbi:MAG: c-type cytochrome [Helicobacteraceae bacterium]|nr:c-type cytochrome [Helicobacteraceae bacterium]
MKYLLTFILLLSLSGCGSSGDDSAENTIDTPTQQNEHQDENTPNNNTTDPEETNTTTSDDNNETIPSLEDNASTCQNSYSEEVMQGQALYNDHCKVCHASDAKSGLFDIRGASKAAIDTAMEEVVNMRELNLGEQISSVQRELIAEYLSVIRDNPDVEFAQECSATPSLSKASLGNRLFFDTNLSLRKTISCSSCHNPGNAFIDARYKQPVSTNSVEGALSVGDDGVTLGGRNAPTAMYAQFAPTFTQNAQGEYVGGQFHDGRAATLKVQAKGPFLDPAEMMMPSAAAVVERVMQNVDYVHDLKTLYGESVFASIDIAYDAIAESIATFEKTDTFAPFSSKYDRSKLDANDPDYYAMSVLEQQGYELFFNTQRTNCVLCHSINSESEGEKELFTNYKYENIGTPKNLDALIERDGNTQHIDLGLGGRSDINDSNHYGKVKVPTLRNIAITAPYMHNGVFKKLRTVLAFYNHMSTNGTNPLNPETNATWGEPQIAQTVNHDLLVIQELSESELDALEAFLHLLTDKEYEALLEN